VHLAPGTEPETSPDILTLQGLATLGLGRVPEGRALLDQAIRTDPRFADALVGLALLDVADRKFESASVLVDRAIEASPKNVDAWLMRADLNRLLNRDSVPAYRRVIELDPKNVLARINLISMQIAVGDYDEARELLDQVNQFSPNNAVAKYLEGLIEFRTGNYVSARTLAVKALKIAPYHRASLLLAGASEYALGNFAEAQSYLGRFVERVPENLYARELLISSLSKIGQTSRARETLRPGLEKAPDDPALLVLAGEVAAQANDMAAAGKYFERAAKLDPKSASARTGLAISRFASGDTDRAIADLELAVTLDPTMYQADVLLVTKYLERGDYEKAWKAQQTLEKKQPKNAITYNLKGAIYLAKKDVPKATKAFERGLELQPSYLPAALNLAKLDLAAKNPASARRRLESLLDKSESNVLVLLALAELGPQIGASQKEQFEWLKRARRENPGVLEPMLAMARLYAQAGNPSASLEVLREAQAVDPTNVELLEMLGRAQIAAGESREALLTYSKIANLKTNSPAALYQLANVQTLNSDTQGATETLRKAIDLEPDYIDAQVALVALKIRSRQFAEATAIARRLQKRAPALPVGFSLEGDVLMADKKFQAAAKLYETAYGLGKSGALAIKLHDAYTQAGMPAEADARLYQWLKLNPDDAIARLYAADSALKMGQYQKAIESYEIIQQKNPDNVLVLNNLAAAYDGANDPRAVPTAERAYQLKPDSPDIADTLGWLLVRRGDAKRGATLLQEAVDKAPRALSFRYHLAQASFNLGDKKKAREELERIMSTDTKFPEWDAAAKLLKQLQE
jgi:putative PEP-CTERM system TPR-repeat lipoprotein